MSWIYEVPVDSATGPVKKEFDAAMARAGRVWNIVHVMSINAMVMKASLAMYKSIMYGSSPLTRVQRELLATVVSAELNCRYWTQAHAHDLRAEVDEDFPGGADAFVHQVVRDWRNAPLMRIDRALCTFAAKVTSRQQELRRDDLESLRKIGLDDRAIHDATQVIAYFNYITRIADALGVEPETFIQEWGA